MKVLEQIILVLDPVTFEPKISFRGTIEDVFFKSGSCDPLTELGMSIVSELKDYRDKLLEASNNVEINSLRLLETERLKKKFGD